MKAIKKYQKATSSFVQAGKEFVNGMESLKPLTVDFIDNDSINNLKNTKGLENIKDWNPLIKY